MNCDLGYYSDDGVEECNFMEMQAYEADLRNIRDCNIKTVVSPQYSYANITGKGWIFKMDLLKDYYPLHNINELIKKTREDSEYSFNVIRDLSSLKIENGDNLKFIAAAPSGGSLRFQPIKSEELFEYSIEEYSTPKEGKIVSVTGDKFDFYGFSIPSGILFKVDDVGNTPHMDKSIRFFHGWGEEDENAFEMMNLKNGKAYFYESREDIEDGGVTDFTNSNKENPFVFSCLMNIPAFGNMGCVYKTYKEAGGKTLDYYKIYPKGETSEPMLLEISSSIAFYPYDVWGGNKVYLEIKPFGLDDDLSRVKIVNNANTAIDFTGKDITITPVAGDWTELGVSFKASIYPLSLPAQCDPGIFIGEECAIGETIEAYDTIECKLPERKCYLNGVEVTGFIDGSVQRTKFCHEDSQCYDNQKCIEGLCVMKATCGNIRLESDRGTLFSRSGINKADVLFIGDGYSSEEELKQDALKVIDENGVNHGLFSTPPFSENNNINKFVFHSMYGSAAPKTFSTISTSPDEENMEYAIQYINGFRKQCPSQDYTILLFKGRDFRGPAIGNIKGAIGEMFGEPGEGIYINTDASNFPLHALHEFGHLFGWLGDEYMESEAIAIDVFSQYLFRPIFGGIIINCIDPDNAYFKWQPEVAERALNEGWYGCGGPMCGDACSGFLRPSLNSIMRHHGIKEGSTEEIQNTVGNGFIFNPPSEAQIIEKLNEYS